MTSIRPKGFRSNTSANRHNLHRYYRVVYTLVLTSTNGGLFVQGAKPTKVPTYARLVAVLLVWVVYYFEYQIPCSCLAPVAVAHGPADVLGPIALVGRCDCSYIDIVQESVLAVNVG